jgi:shikimate kinase
VKDRQHIYLIGLPGSGKTTLGRQLAQQVRWPFVDLDGALEHDQQQTVSAIFHERGEDYFRQVEARVLREVAQRPHRAVVATGGGAPCFWDNLDVMLATGTTVFLDVPILEIAKRLDQSHAAARPLLAASAGHSLTDHLAFLRTQRLPFYQKAHHTISGVSPTVGDVLMVLGKTF